MDIVTRSRAVWSRRSVLSTLVTRDLRVRYAQSWLGYLWTVLDPLLMSAVYYVVFVFILERGRLGHQPFFLFLVIGLLSWQFFSGVLNESARALLSESKLVRSTNLPREIWVLRVVLSKAVEYVFSLPVLVVFAALYVLRGETSLNASLLLFPLGVLVQLVALTGLGLVLAPVTVLVNDLKRVVRIGLRVLFYASPVIYTSHLIPEPYNYVMWLNPMTGVLEMMRAGFFDHDGYPIIWGSIGVSAVVAVVLLLVGIVVFRRLERPVLKEI